MPASSDLSSTPFLGAEGWNDDQEVPYREKKSLQIYPKHISEPHTPKLILGLTFVVALSLGFGIGLFLQNPTSGKLQLAPVRWILLVGVVCGVAMRGSRVNKFSRHNTYHIHYPDDISRRTSLLGTPIGRLQYCVGGIDSW